MTAQTARLLVDGNGQIIPNQYYDVVTNSFKASSSSNPLPVAATNKKLPTIESSATLQSTSDECVISCDNYKSGSFVFQASANTSLILALYTTVDGIDRTIMISSPSFGTTIPSPFSVVSNSSGFYAFEIPVGATSIKLKPVSFTSGSVDVKLYLGESTVHQVSLRGGSRVGFVARSAIWTRESTTPVNANLTITGAVKTTFATPSGVALSATTAYGDKFAASAGADVEGTLVIDASPNSGATYYPIASVALTQTGGTGNFGAYLETPIVEATMRARLVNGASNQANAYLATKILG